MKNGERKFVFLFFLIVTGMLLTGCILFPKPKTTAPRPRPVVPQFDDRPSYDSSTLRGVTKITDDGLAKDYATISPDGTKMLYTEFESVKNNTLGRIYLLKDVRYPAKTLIAGDFAYNPAWYEDNSGFVFVNYEETGRKLIKSTISGGGRTYVTRNPIGSEDRHPSIRGNMILCDTTINGRRQIVSLLDNGTEVTVLGEGYSPNCHPAARKAVFIRDGKIFEMDLVTTQVTEIYSNSNYKCDNPSYSKDGNMILFQRENAVTGMSGVIRQHIFSISASGSGGETPLVYGNVDATCPTWGTDNSFYFISNAGGNTEIWRANLQ